MPENRTPHRAEEPRRRRRKVALFLTGTMLVGGGIAYAYWTASGSGTGSASTNDEVNAITVNQTSTVSNLRPGYSAQTLEGDFDNPNDEPVYISSVTAAVQSVVDGGGDTIDGCDSSDYTIGGTATVNAEIPTGTSQGSWSGLTIQFNNKNSNQDACRGAVVKLAYTAD